MYLMYVDESGDTGSLTRYFVLSGLVVHEFYWRDTLDQIIDFRRRMRGTFSLKLREELHAARMISRPGKLVRIKRNDRLTILRSFADELAAMPHLNVINVVVDKQYKTHTYDVFEEAWTALIQRFENTIVHRNFPGSSDTEEHGMIFPDYTDVKKLTNILRRMHHYNPVPNQRRYGAGYRSIPLSKIVEDPIFKDSEASYFIQAADLIAFLLYQNLDPNSYMRSKGGHNYFNRLEPILCRYASSIDPQGIVRL